MRHSFRGTHRSALLRTTFGGTASFCFFSPQSASPFSTWIVGLQFPLSARSSHGPNPMYRLALVAWRFMLHVFFRFLKLPLLPINKRFDTPQSEPQRFLFTTGAMDPLLSSTSPHLAAFYRFESAVSHSLAPPSDITLPLPTSDPKTLQVPPPR